MSTLPATRLEAPSLGRDPVAVKTSRPSQMSQGVAGRPLVGVAVVVFIVLLQTTNQLLSGHLPSRVFFHLCYLAVELTAVLSALSLTYASLTRRQVGATAAVGFAVLVAGTVGAAFGIGLFMLGREHPGILIRPIANLTVLHGALYGFSLGQFHMGLWALGFAYPRAIAEARKKEVEAEQLRSAAELARLRAHLEPHFLLNTLNAIAGLVTEEPKEARRLIGCLGDLLRDALHDDQELQSVRAQIVWLQRYAAILQARHAGSLSFTWDIAPDAAGELLPRLLLQPLVENAVKHGALQRRGGGKVAVTVRWVGETTLECVVEDNGPGARNEDVRPGAFGLRAIVRRLDLKYPGARMTLDPLGLQGDPESSGTRASILIPRAALDIGNAPDLRAAAE
jgi:signal transduction histidine kinase